jgi:hypothetical protein
MRAFAGEEFFGQRVDHRPLIRRGVLGFVDQNVIQALIQLVERPDARFGVREQAPAPAPPDR